MFSKFLVPDNYRVNGFHRYELICILKPLRGFVEVGLMKIQIYTTVITSGWQFSSWFKYGFKKTLLTILILIFVGIPLLHS